MKVKIVIGLLVIVISGVLLREIWDTKRASNIDQMSGIDGSSQEILDATVQITMVVSLADNHEVRAKGLGSLVDYNGHILLVTHNHWGELLRDDTTIEIYDADHRPLKEISGSGFKRLICYQDTGTLILQAPAGLGLHPAATGNRIGAGDKVMVAYRQTAGGDKVTVLGAIVDTVIPFNGLPAYKLLSLDGQPIRGGDSGWGVWHDGQLVGNMWGTVEVESSSILAVLTGNEGAVDVQPTNKSLAALLPMDLRCSPRARSGLNSSNGVRSE